MFTKALIKEVPKQGSNIWKVRIPLFEDTTDTEIIYDALCCHSPGTFGGLNVGDCVYVSFEDAKLNIPVIVGRLYTEELDDYAKGLFNNLNVLNSANLPINTTFGGKLSILRLYEVMQYILALEGNSEQRSLEWGNISGNIINQTDLWDILESKVNNTELINKTFPIGTVYSNVNDAFDPNTEWPNTTWEYMYSIVDASDNDTIKKYWKRVA